MNKNQNKSNSFYWRERLSSYAEKLENIRTLGTHDEAASGESEKIQSNTNENDTNTGTILDGMVWQQRPCSYEPVSSTIVNNSSGSVSSFCSFGSFEFFGSLGLERSIESFSGTVLNNDPSKS